MIPIDPLAFESIRLHEGSVGLPPTFDDRTANIFVPKDPQSQPNLSIARDWLLPEETLSSYVDRQLKLLKARMPNHKLVGRDVERLGQGTDANQGERVDVHYKTNGQTVRQRQAAFCIGTKRVIIFTAASPHLFDEPLETLWRQWLDSFVPVL